MQSIILFDNGEEIDTHWVLQIVRKSIHIIQPNVEMLEWGIPHSKSDIYLVAL